VRSNIRFLASLCVLSCLIAGLFPIASAAAGSATMRWTAPGDDSLAGRATAYDVRYSLAPITAANFTSATKVTGVPAPKVAGSAESLTVTNLVAGSGYYFALKTVDEAANWSGISNVLYSLTRTTAVQLPLAFSLSPPWPNPAYGSAHWSYTLPEPGPMELVAFDLAGRRVRRIASEWAAAGQGEASWDLRDDGGRPVAPGVYLVRATLGGRTAVNRLVVTR
jgi:hypothetical protein